MKKSTYKKLLKARAILESIQEPDYNFAQIGDYITPYINEYWEKEMEGK